MDLAPPGAGVRPSLPAMQDRLRRKTMLEGGMLMLKRALTAVARRRPDRDDGLGSLVANAQGPEVGHAPGRYRRPQVTGRAVDRAQQGDARVPHLGAAHGRRRRHHEGLRHPGAGRLLRFRRGLRGARATTRSASRASRRKSSARSRSRSGRRPSRSVLRSRPSTKASTRDGAISPASASSRGLCRSTPGPTPSAASMRWA